jgi:hypothetical protein
VQPPRQSEWIRQGMRQPSHYIMVTKFSSGGHNNKERNKKIKQAKVKEILMCFVTLFALMQLLKEEIKGVTALTCHLFTKKCPIESCIMRKPAGDKIYLLLIYVNDILVIAKEAEFYRLQKAFTQEFRWTSMEVRDVLSYLGMRVELREGCVFLDMFLLPQEKPEGSC